MKRALLFFTAFFLLLPLAACDQRRALELPEVESLRAKLRAAVPEIDSVFVSFGNSGEVQWEFRYGENGQALLEEDAFSIVGEVRALFMQEGFQEDMLAAVCRASREDALAGGTGAPGLQVYILDTWYPPTLGRYSYHFSARFFSGGAYDGYAAWEGYRYDVDPMRKEPIPPADIPAAGIGSK